jgi:hypothetical protein
MRKHYSREDLGKGVRGKFLADYQSGTNLVLLRPEIAAAFPTAEAVNEALMGLLKVAATARITSRSTRTRAKARAG